MTNIYSKLRSLFAHHPNGQLKHQSPRMLRDMGIDPADIRRARWDTPGYWVEP